MYQIDLDQLDSWEPADMFERICEADGCANVGSTSEMVQDGEEWFCPDCADRLGIGDELGA